MTSKNTDGLRRLESVVKTLDIIEALWRTEGAGVTELTRTTGLPKSTVHAHLSTLRSKGYVVQDGDTYRISLRFLSFGEHVKRSEPLYEAAKEPVADLARRTGERILCSTQQNGLGTVLLLEEGESSVSTDIRVGTHTYLHCSAAGKAMLAHFPSEAVERVVESWGLPEFTERTITDRQQLFSELETVREAGVAHNRSEYLPGVHAVGAPVLRDDGRVAGAVAVTGAERRLKNEWDEADLRNQLLATANTIEVNLMFS